MNNAKRRVQWNKFKTVYTDININHGQSNTFVT